MRAGREGSIPTICGRIVNRAKETEESENEWKMREKEGAGRK